MIPNVWYAVLDAKEIKPGKLLGVTRLGEKLVFWRDAHGRVNCLRDRCCHRGAALSKGKCLGDTVACPFHGFRYDATGRVVEIPANGKDASVSPLYQVEPFQVTEAYGFIWLWYGNYQPLDALPEIPFFESLRHDFVYSGFSETWPVHYTRAIENQLDVVHLPFVHKTTIGRGNATLVNGPVIKWHEDRMTFYVANAKDEGQSPLKASEITDYEKYFHLQLQMPNLWQNCISDKVRIVAAFAPIDDTNTRIYLRFYQRFAKAPILRQIVGWGAGISNRIILHQDRRVVLTQRPVKTALKMNEHLIQGDMPIIEYRKKRAAMKRPMV
ncbi:Rieske 2Fe-2S domain-containing protein [Fusibacter sp. JL298sf-3]